EAHADAPVAPGDLRLDVDVLLAHRHAEAHLDDGPLVERVGGADGHAAAADVERDGGGNRVAQAVGDRNAEDDARARTTVDLAGEQMRRERRQDVLERGVLVDVAADVQRGELLHFAGVGDRAAEHDDRRFPGIDTAQRAYEVHAVAVRQPQVHHHEIDVG